MENNLILQSQSKLAQKMDKADGKTPAFPAGYEQVEERLNDTIKHVRQLEDQIKNIPKEEKLTIKYDPPYGIGRIIPGTANRTRAYLRHREHEAKVDMLSETEGATRNADGKAGRIVRDMVREKLFPNLYRQVSREDRLGDKDAPKDIEQSQDYMDAELVERAAKREEARQPQKQETPEMSMSARFSLSLGYTKATNKLDKTPAPVRQQDKDRD